MKLLTSQEFTLPTIFSITCARIKHEASHLFENQNKISLKDFWIPLKSRFYLLQPYCPDILVTVSAKFA